MQKGYKIMGMYDGGFHHFLNNKRPIYGPDDLKGIKIRVMGVPPYIDGIKAYDANPLSISYGELYTALQQGVIDAAEQNLDSINRMKFYEVVKYVSLSAWAGAVDVMFLSTKLWNSLSPADQKIFEGAGRESVKFQREIFKKGVDSGLDVILKAGVKVNLVYQPAFYKQAESVYKIYEKDIPPSLIKRIKAVK
jgi:TRAP-type C4-dicarboxylate transport system substrate-binding protein